MTVLFLAVISHRPKACHPDLAMGGYPSDVVRERI